MYLQRQKRLQMSRAPEEYLQQANFLADLPPCEVKCHFPQGVLGALNVEKASFGCEKPFDSKKRVRKTRKPLPRSKKLFGKKETLRHAKIHPKRPRNGTVVSICACVRSSLIISTSFEWNTKGITLFTKFSFSLNIVRFFL